MTTSEHTAALLRYLSDDLTGDTVPEEVWRRIEDLFLDWLASALAAAETHPIPTFGNIARQMGPSDGSAQILASDTRSSPYWAAWVNAASSHTLEQDDLHNSSVMHPATVIFPAVLAAAQDNNLSGSDLLLASIAGYEAGIRIAESLGRSHYRIFHTTATVGTVAAALAVAKLLGLGYDQVVSVLGTAGTQTSGLWEFMRSGAGDSKQLHCAHAASNGLLSAYMVRDGLKGAQDVIEGGAGLMKGMSGPDADGTRLSDRLGARWAVLETSFKFHACCRHTHPAADALLDAIAGNGIRDAMVEIERITAHVHQGAVDVLGPVDASSSPPKTVHAAKFSMKSTLSLIALKGSASLLDFEKFALTDPDVLQFRERISMVLDGEVDLAYPKRWLGRVEVKLADGRVVWGTCDEPKGDPGNTLTRSELEDKFRRLNALSSEEGNRSKQ
ncbi:hypothetical protein M406DRAFT_340973 [Cryphonectria parasitica EP155]|uniref:2-methylcitrate dehydratase n=1 Tax=Cryphonectria parasitica (strain ATCC 38755 / EP155) TaxID=660469 RepID=A0A9P4XYS8_CRYP1|nr:uncharacterized protein M406DRAFT_340973 [Cryphonectria parasitica EP155]KAF3763388.1 hypothetical protein M406DRAFT_340973 [Cryphonectria parasitica EP155]